MDLSLTVLGCAPSYPRPGQPCSGYLIESDETKVWVDCGSGTFAALQSICQPGDLTAIWVSHLHPDHVADLFACINWALNTPEAPRIEVYGPPGWAANLGSALPSDDGERQIRDVFEVHDLSDGHLAEVGDLTLQSRQVRHSVPAFGLRVTGDDSVIAYTGDSGPCDALTDLAERADILVGETGALTSEPYHCTPEETGSIAAAAGVDRLVLTHVNDGAERQSVLNLATARHTHSLLAEPGLTVVDRH